MAVVTLKNRLFGKTFTVDLPDKFINSCPKKGKKERVADIVFNNHFCLLSNNKTKYEELRKEIEAVLNEYPIVIPEIPEVPEEEECDIQCCDIRCDEMTETTEMACYHFELQEQIPYGEVLGLFEFRGDLFYRLKGGSGRLLQNGEVTFIERLKEKYPDEFGNLTLKKSSSITVTPLTIPEEE